MAQDTILGKSLYDFLQGTQKLKKRKFLEWHLSVGL